MSKRLSLNRPQKKISKEGRDLGVKVRYVGPTFGAAGLTANKVYDCLGEDCDGSALIIVDDSGEAYLYSAINPSPLDGSSSGGRWEIVEDDADGLLARIISRANLSSRAAV